MFKVLGGILAVSLCIAYLATRERKQAVTTPAATSTPYPIYSDDDLPKDAWSAHALQEAFAANPSTYVGRPVKIAGHVSRTWIYNIGAAHSASVILDEDLSVMTTLCFNPSCSDARIASEPIERIRALQPGTAITASCVIAPESEQLSLTAPQFIDDDGTARSVMMSKDGKRRGVDLVQCHLLSSTTIASHKPLLPSAYEVISRVPEERARKFFGGKFAEFKTRLEVSGPITKDGNYFVGMGCQQHMCSDDEAAFVVDQTFNSFVAVMLSNGRDIDLFGASSLESLPPPLKAWVAEHHLVIGSSTHTTTSAQR